jgi:integrase
MWNWGLLEGHIIGTDGKDLANPCSLTRRREEKSKDRVLTDDEIKALWGCTDDSGDYSRIVRLLLLTACRREEIGGCCGAR